MIDNYDSFTYNLVQYLGGLGQKVCVFRNDKITLEEVAGLKFDQIVISPGPGRPEDAGVSLKVIKDYYQKVPILGVCLGHQAIGYVFGAAIVKAPTIMHGKTSQILHNGKDIFKGIKSPFEATRYHSLVIDKKTLPANLLITAHTEDGVIMGVREKSFPLFGVQFHPESILTPDGKKILKNFLKYD